MNRARSWSGAGPWAVFLFYLAAGLEVIVMITPFAAYFYSVYAPILEFLQARPGTAWLTAFFLPHMSYTGDPILTGLAYLGPLLLGIGLLIFLVGAVQVYSAKLFRRGVVTGGLYARVRHPQYLGLGLAGLGLLLYWPRFAILVLYVTMLFVYDALARHEERRMAERYGTAYRAYAERLPRFLPGWPGRLLWTRWTGGRPLSGGARAALFAVVLLASLGLAAGLREYSKTRLTRVRDRNVVVVSLGGGDRGAVRSLWEAVTANPDVRERLSRHPDAHGLVAYVLPQEYMMQHLVADLSEHQAHHGGGEAAGLWPPIVHVAEMYALKPLRQLRAAVRAPNQRIIVTEAVEPSGRPVSADRALDAGVLRFPLFFADLEGREVVMTMDTPPRHAWGRIPVPAF